MPAAWPTASTPTGRRCVSRARSTSTSRSTAPLRSSCRDPDAAERRPGRCRHLLVDEFQDLNPAHMLLIRLLSAPAYDMFGVGDDDQVIYGYAGATPEYLIDFEDYFPGAQGLCPRGQLPLPPAVVTAATHVLSYNAARIAKTITTPVGSTDARPCLRRTPPAVMVPSPSSTTDAGLLPSPRWPPSRPGVTAAYAQ